MGIDIRLPNITATTTEGQMSQMQSYMHQLVEQLNWALASVDNAIQGNTSNVVMTSRSGQNSEEDALDTFNSIKALIIKSADIVQAYEESMREDFSGEYVAISDFGKYKRDTNLAIETTSNRVDELFTSVESIETEERKTNAYIRRGLLDEANNIYGVEVGETIIEKKDGEEEKETFNKFARFTADRLSFFNKNGNEVAYISSNRLYIQDATFLGSVQFKGYTADTSVGLAFYWTGG